MKTRGFLVPCWVVLLACGLGFAAEVIPTPVQPGLIREENGKPGAADWQLTRVRLDQFNYRSA